MTAPTDAVRLRVVIINFDESWAFPDLVRRHALDVFANPRAAVDIRFRTIGGRDPDKIAGKRLAAWGASRPRAYGDDWQSLADDLIEDVAALVDHKFEQLAIVGVVADPDRVPPGELLFQRTFAVLRQLEAELFEHGGASTTTRRYVCVRQSQTVLHDSPPRVDELIDLLLLDPAGTGRQPADQVFVLRPPRLRPADLDGDDRHFLLLRVAVEAAVARVTDSDGAAGATSPVGELLNMKEPLMLSIEGNPVATTSAAIAGLVAAYRQHVVNVEPSLQSIVDDSNPTKTKVKDLLEKIGDDIRVTETDFGLVHLQRPAGGFVVDDDSLSAEAMRTQSEIDREVYGVTDRTIWWTSAAERDLHKILGDLPEKVQGFVDRTLISFQAVRAQHEENTIQDRDTTYRSMIAAIPVGGGGLAGASAILIDKIKDEIDAVRARYRRRAELARKRFMGALLPELKRDDGGRRTAEPNEFHKLDLDRLEAFIAIEHRLEAVRAAYRGLVPRVYLTAWLALSGGALATVLTHALAKAKGNVWLALTEVLWTRSGALLAAVVLAAVLGYFGIRAGAKVERSKMWHAVDDLMTSHETLWRRVQAMTDRAIDYVTISRQLMYFDLVEAEMKRRIAETDADAFSLAVEDMRAPEIASAPQPFFTDLDARLSQLPVRCWVRHILEPTTFSFASAAPAMLAFEWREGQDRRGLAGLRATGMPGVFTTQSTLFTADQTVTVTPLRQLADAFGNVPSKQAEPLS